ncbi:MAG: hypothetical protein ABH883_09630, partial [Candidatus Omnitrophota bacterium]
KRMEMMISMLHERGLNINGKKVFESSPYGSVGRLHLARVLVKQKLVGSLKDAFDQYIGDGKTCYVVNKRLDYTKAIEMILRAGGVPVLAHPAIKGLDDHIPAYVKAGLRGIEVFHTKHKSGDDLKYIALAEKHGLLITGGSDCHGLGRHGILMGKVKVNYDIVEKLREEAEKIRGAGKRS